jgi:hypothetical protein
MRLLRELDRTLGRLLRVVLLGVLPLGLLAVAWIRAGRRWVLLLRLLVLLLRLLRVRLERRGLPNMVRLLDARGRDACLEAAGAGGCVRALLSLEKGHDWCAKRLVQATENH